MQSSVNDTFPQATAFPWLHDSTDGSPHEAGQVPEPVSLFETQGSGYQFDLTAVAGNLPSTGLPDSRLTLSLQASNGPEMQQLILVDYAGLKDHAMPTPKWNTLVSMKARGEDKISAFAIDFPADSPADSPNSPAAGGADRQLISGPYFLRFTGWGRDWAANTLTNNSQWHLHSLEFEQGWRIRIGYTNCTAVDQMASQALVNLTILKMSSKSS